MTVSDRERKSRDELQALEGQRLEETWRASIDKHRRQAQQALERGAEGAAGFLAGWASSEEKEGPKRLRARRIGRINKKYNAVCEKCGADTVVGPVVITGKDHECLCHACAEKLAEQDRRSALYYDSGVNLYGRQSFKPEYFEPCQHCERLVMHYKVAQKPSSNHACCCYCREAINRELRRSRPEPTECPVCHESFEPQRKSATYCGPTCRQRAKRLRDAFNTPPKEATR